MPNTEHREDSNMENSSTKEDDLNRMVIQGTNNYGEKMEILQGRRKKNIKRIRILKVTKGSSHLRINIKC